MPMSLAALRDLLLPGIYTLNGKGGPEVGINIDYANDCIMLLARGHREVLYTRQDIENQTYRTGDLTTKVEAIKAKASAQYVPYGSSNPT